LRLRPDVPAESNPLIFDVDRQRPHEGLRARVLCQALQHGVLDLVIGREDL